MPREPACKKCLRLGKAAFIVIHSRITLETSPRWKPLQARILTCVVTACKQAGPPITIRLDPDWLFVRNSAARRHPGWTRRNPQIFQHGS
ncbi:MAG: hypothetical protein VX715_04120 [Planctomycetota bacterium]|nr:hypothetical protein [Planctomycetota bacterium]